jgi:hypothetical protein
MTLRIQNSVSVDNQHSALAMNRGSLYVGAAAPSRGAF